MKAAFVPKFLDELKCIGIDLFHVWANIPYKGFRMSNNWSPSFSRGIRNLEGRKLITKDVNRHYRFSDIGKVWLRKTLLKYHKSIGTKWDGKWRIVMFDIPHERQKQRHIFRAKLKDLGFQMLQKSVFAIPYQCGEEIAHICKHLKLSSHVELIVAETVGSREDHLKKLFAL